MSYKKFAKDFGFSIIANIIGAISGIIILPLIIKVLGAEDYGIWAQLFVTISLLSTIALMGLPYTLLRFLAGEKDEKSIQDGIWSTVTIVFAVSILISLSLIFFSNPIANFFSCPELYVKILALIVLFEYPNQVFYSVFRAFQQNIKFNIFYLFQGLGQVVLMILSIFLNYGLLGAIMSVLAIRIISFLIMGGDIILKIGFTFPKFLKTKEYLSFGLPTVPDFMSWWIINSSDRYLVGFYLGTLFVGYYASAYSISSFAMGFLMYPFSFLLPAILSKLYDENRFNEARIYLRYSLKYFLILAIPAVFGLSVLSKQILTVLATPESAQAGYLVMPIVALGMLAMGANAITSQIMGILKKTKASATIATISAFLNLGLNIIFIPLFGIIGAAVTTFVAIAFLFLSTCIYSFKYFKFEIDWQSIMKSVLASCVMSYLIYLMHPAGLSGVLLAIFLGVIIYGIVLLLVKGFAKKELELFKQITKRA